MLAHRIQTTAAHQNYLTNTNVGIALIASVDTSSNDVVIPGTPQAGDLLVLLSAMYRVSSASSTTVTGFTLITSANATINTDNYRIGAWYRVCDGTEGSSIAYTHSILEGFTYLFRADEAITGIQSTPSTNWTVQSTGGNPASQTISAAGQTLPLIALAMSWNDSGSLGFTTENPAFDQSDSLGTRGEAGVTIYNSSPLDHSVDTGDSSYANGLISGFIVPQY